MGHSLLFLLLYSLFFVTHVGHGVRHFRLHLITPAPLAQSSKRSKPTDSRVGVTEVAGTWQGQQRRQGAIATGAAHQIV